MAINKLIFAFVTLILGVALLSSIAVLTNDATSKTTQVNDSINIKTAKVLGTINSTLGFPVTNAPTSWKILDCPLTGITVENSSGQPLTVTTDYLLAAADGILYLQNTSDAYNETVDNLTYVTYTYCADDYINSSWGRTVLNLIAGFFAIALLLVSVGLFYSVAKDSGLVG